MISDIPTLEPSRRVRKLTLAVTLLVASATCFGQPLCNLHTSTAHQYGGIYVGNSGPGRFILIGTIRVPHDCLTTGFTFNASHVDSVSLTNHYEISLYCIRGKCTPLARVLDSGELTTAQFFPSCPSGDYSSCSIPRKNGNRPHYIPYGQAVETIPWAGGTALLAAGSYALAMGTDCVSNGYHGSGECGEGYGEIASQSETFDFKVFTADWPTWTRCLIWNNGLPDKLCVTPVPSPTNGAPHMIDFQLW